MDVVFPAAIFEKTVFSSLSVWHSCQISFEHIHKSLFLASLLDSISLFVYIYVSTTLFSVPTQLAVYQEGKGTVHSSIWRCLTVLWQAVHKDALLVSMPCVIAFLWVWASPGNFQLNSDGMSLLGLVYKRECGFLLQVCSLLMLTSLLPSCLQVLPSAGNQLPCSAMLSGEACVKKEHFKNTNQVK